ncbi:unnamed protein product, partial [Ixodes pacificus]
ARISPANEHSLTARTVKPTPKVCDAAFAPHEPTGRIPNLRTSNAQQYQGLITPAFLPLPFVHINAHTHPPNRCRRPTTIHARQPIHPPDTRKHDNNRSNKQQQTTTAGRNHSVSRSSTTHPTTKTKQQPTPFKDDDVVSENHLNQSTVCRG